MKQISYSDFERILIMRSSDVLHDRSRIVEADYCEDVSHRTSKIYQSN